MHLHKHALCPSLGDHRSAEDSLYSLRQTRESIGDVEYWRQLCPDLTIGGELPEACEPFEFPELELRRLKQQMITDGFFILDPSQVPWAIDVREIGRGIVQLSKYGWHPNYIMLYDQPWTLAHQLSDVMLQSTGNRVTFDWLAYHIEPPDGTGFPPHRDGSVADAHCWHADGGPRIVTVWVSLGQSGPANSCLHVLPASKDPYYRTVNPAETSHDVIATAEAFQDIVAVPLEPGGLVAFSHRTYHWGSACTPYATEPRVSLAFLTSHEALKKPYLPAELLPLPPFHLRLALTCGQMLIYSKVDDCDPALVDVQLRVFMGQAVHFDETFAQMVLNAPVLRAARGRRQQPLAVEL